MKYNHIIYYKLKHNHTIIPDDGMDGGDIMITSQNDDNDNKVKNNITILMKN